MKSPLSNFIIICIGVSCSAQNVDNYDNDDRRLLDPFICRRARSLVDWGESFNNRGEESLWKAIEKRCCYEETTVRIENEVVNKNNSHM